MAVDELKELLKPDAKSREFTAQDAGGREVPLLDPVALGMLHRGDVIETDALRELAAEIGSGLTKTRRRLMYVFLVSGGLCGLVLLISTVELILTGRFAEFSGGMAVVLSQVWFWSLIMWINAKRGRYKRTLRVMLEHRRCPHCGYNLRGLRIAPDDSVTVCPECGCAWLVNASESAGQA